MSRAKLFNMIKSRGEHPVGRNPFDLTNRHVYTQKVAKIMPVKAFHTMPDDYLDVTMSEFSQNNIPMNTAAFLSGKKELLAYFVPYNSIWHNYNQYQATREDPESAALKVKGISYEPRFALSMLYFRALYFTIGSWMFESYSQLRAPWRWYQTFRNAGSTAWLDFKNKYGDPATLQDLIQFMKDNHYASSAQNDWEHFVRMSSNEIANWKFSQFGNVRNFPFAVAHDCFEHAIEHDDSLTYGDTILDMFGTPIWSDWIAKLDMLRYGNLVPLLNKLRTNLDARVNAILDGLFTSEVSTIGMTIGGNNGQPQISYEDFLFLVIDLDFHPDAVQGFFLDYVFDVIDKLTFYSKRSQSGDFTEDEYVNVYALYSYNKCFYDYMRNVYYDTNYSVYNYNCDFADCTDFESSIITPRYLPCRFYHLESHQWKKDMFTGVLPSNQLGAVSQVSINIPSLEIHGDTDTPDYVGNSSISKLGGDSPAPGPIVNSGHDLYDSSDNQVNIRNVHSHTLSVGTSTYASSASFDVLALKRAEALQQYAQDLMRAGNRTQDIFNQIYGVTPKSQLDETPYFIDVASSDININPIIATAATGNDVNGKLGDIAARVTISTSKPLSFKFSTKDFGVVLFLSYIVPDSMYNSYNLDPCVTHLDPESHGLPYFQNLGLQPVIGSYLNNLKGVDVRNRICGYAPPYIERKTDIDLVHGILVDTYLPKVTDAGRDDEYNGELSHWVVARTDMQQEDTVSLRNFYIDPRIVDNVFRFSADSTPSTDHFLTYSSITVNAVRALSELGLPRF